MEGDKICIKKILEEIIDHYLNGVPFSDVLEIVSVLYHSNDRELRHLASLIEHEPSNHSQNYFDKIVEIAKNYLSDERNEK